MVPPVIYLAMPIRGRSCSMGAALGSQCEPTTKYSYVFDFVSSSLLTFGFNMLWTRALNSRAKRGITHFAMLHDDVCPDGNKWLDTLMAELVENDADMVSAVVPLKDERGLTSTAIETDHEWLPKKLSMTEVFDLPETFTHPGLLCNTGMWLCKLTEPWAEKVCFRQYDRIIEVDGQFAPQTMSEDWDFSRQLRGFGCKIMATRKVKLSHERNEFHNRSVWGSWKTDAQTV